MQVAEFVHLTKRNDYHDNQGKFSTGSSSGIGWQNTKSEVRSVTTASGVPHQVARTEYLAPKSGLSVRVNHDLATDNVNIESSVPGMKIPHLSAFAGKAPAEGYLNSLGIEHRF